MPTYDLICSGEHVNPPVLGHVTYDDQPTPAQLASAQQGYLCEDCGDTYIQLTADFADGRPGLPPRVIPTAAAVDVTLAAHGKSRRKPK